MSMEPLVGCRSRSSRGEALQHDSARGHQFRPWPDDWALRQHETEEDGAGGPPLGREPIGTDALLVLRIGEGAALGQHDRELLIGGEVQTPVIERDGDASRIVKRLAVTSREGVTERWGGPGGRKSRCGEKKDRGKRR